MDRLLLHICCAPDGAYALELLKPSYHIACYFFNPNIDDAEEYEKRKKDAAAIAAHYGAEFITPAYSLPEWRACITGLESEPEGGARCTACYEFRLRACARKAKELGIPFFTTVLTISPHKNSKVIFEIAQRIEAETGTRFLYTDFKKKDGFKKSVTLSRQLNLYRQNYCGCSYSKRERENNKEA